MRARDWEEDMPPMALRQGHLSLPQLNYTTHTPLRHSAHRSMACTSILCIRKHALTHTLFRSSTSKHTRHTHTHTKNTPPTKVQTEALVITTSPINYFLNSP